MLAIEVNFLTGRYVATSNTIATYPSGHRILPVCFLRWLQRGLTPTIQIPTSELLSNGSKHRIRLRSGHRM